MKNEGFPSESDVQTRLSNHIQQLPVRTAVVQTWGANLGANPAGLQCKPLGADPGPKGPEFNSHPLS